MEVELSEVTKTIRGKNLLDHVSYTFCEGNVYAIAGENGSGKTMLLKAICGLIRLSSGYIKINGEIVGQDIDVPRNVGLLLENPAFIASYTGRKNLKTIARIGNTVNDVDIERVLEKVGLADAASKPFGKYSLGMKQRLGVACAIMEKSKLLLLDEPTNSIDPDSIESIYRAIIDTITNETVVIIASHDLESVSKIADRTLIMQDGTLRIAKP